MCGYPSPQQQLLASLVETGAEVAYRPTNKRASALTHFLPFHDKPCYGGDRCFSTKEATRMAGEESVQDDARAAVAAHHTIYLFHTRYIRKDDRECGRPELK